MEKIGQKIFELRKQRGLSQDDLADKIGVSRQTIYKWENDSVLPNTENMKLLSKALSVEDDYFFSTFELEVAIQKLKEEKRKKTLKICVFTGIILLSVSIVILFGLSIWFGFSALSSNSGDVSVSSKDITIMHFVYIVVALVVAILSNIILIVFYKKKLCKQNVNKM